MRVLILYMAFLWWEKKYPVLRGTEQKPVDPKINRLCFQRRKRGTRPSAAVHFMGGFTAASTAKRWPEDRSTRR